MKVCRTANKEAMKKHHMKKIHENECIYNDSVEIVMILMMTTMIIVMLIMPMASSTIAIPWRYRFWHLKSTRK